MHDGAQRNHGQQHRAQAKAAAQRAAAPAGRRAQDAPYSAAEVRRTVRRKPVQHLCGLVREALRQLVRAEHVAQRLRRLRCQYGSRQQEQNGQKNGDFFHIIPPA